jgi:Phosphorylase superfamily
MPAEALFQTGTFKGVSVADPFAMAAIQQQAVTIKLGPIPWPAGLAPTPTPLGAYQSGEKITTALNVKADVLIVLYTEDETSALLDVLTGNNQWTPARQNQWCGYAHNFDTFKPIIQFISGDNALEQGMFGYLSALKIGTKTVVLYKSELHPKQNGTKLPFVPVLQQLITELAPSLVISTGTAGAIGPNVNCGDVVITSSARFHCRDHYPPYPDIFTMSTAGTQLTNTVAVNSKYLDYAAGNLTKLSLTGLSQCFSRLQTDPKYAFVKKPVNPPAIYFPGKNPVPGSEPMDIVSADYLTVDDNLDTEGLQPLGVMNDTDDAFLFYAINKIPGKKPAWLSVRNASEPQIVGGSYPPGTSRPTIMNNIKSLAGTIYGIYQYCTTLNSAFACWGVIASM